MINLAEKQYVLDVKKFFFEAIEWFRENRQMTDLNLNSLFKVAGITK